MAWLAGDVLTAIEALAPTCGCVTLDKLAERLPGHSPQQLSNCCGHLTRVKFLSHSKRGCYRITEAGKTALREGAALKTGPKPGYHQKKARGLRQRAWRYMRSERKFDLDGLQGVVCDGSEKAAAANLYQYVAALCGVGFLVALPRRGKSATRYYLERDSGRLAPVYRRKTQEVFDPNSGEIYRLQEDA
ncbi:MAG: winged helix-turn-helix domain-containing protein [Methylococcaceae bacterium]|nr:MAG: winged helix-turn-helix domain-containing protein [Methylococcaceae bacterium]